MSLVGEMDEVWHIMNLYPGNGLLGLPVGVDFRDFSRVSYGCYPLVTTYALRNARNPSGRGLVRIRVTVQAFNLVVPSMNTMTELDGLYRL